MHEFLLMHTGLVPVGKGHPQHMSKLHDNADARRARGACVCALRALVLFIMCSSILCNVVNYKWCDKNLCNLHLTLHN